MSGRDEMSGRGDESCDIMRHHAIGSGSGSGAGGVRCHSTKGVAEERRGGGSGSGRQAGVGSGSGCSWNKTRCKPVKTFLLVAMNMEESDRPIDFQSVRQEVSNLGIKIDEVLTYNVIDEHYALLPIHIGRLNAFQE